jgi:hypothetical protein
MSETRPSGTPVVPDAPNAVIQEVAVIDERGRLHLLPRWTKQTDWIPTPATAPVDAILIFVEPGLVSLRNWETVGTQIVERYQAICSEHELSTEVLRLIHDRYRKLAIPVDRRPHLGDATLVHLGLPITREAKSVVYVFVAENRIDILSPAYRNAKLVAGDARLDDLP